MASCKHCDEEITFSSEYTSPKSGKKIPLDPDTMEPHSCMESLNAWRQNNPLICNRCNKTKIYFDSNGNGIQKTVK